MPDLSVTRRIGIEVELAATTVSRTVVMPGSILLEDVPTTFLLSAVSAEARVSPAWVIGGELPYVASNFPDSVSGIGNLSGWARWTRANRTDGRTTSIFGIGFGLAVPTAKRPTDVESDPDLAGDVWLPHFTRFKADLVAARMHVDLRVGGRTFFQAQASLDAGGHDGDPFVLPRFSVGAGGYVSSRFALVAEAVGVVLPGSGHDIGDGSYMRGGGEAGARYVGERFYGGIRAGAFVADGYKQYAFGVGGDVSYLF